MNRDSSATSRATQLADALAGRLSALLPGQPQPLAAADGAPEGVPTGTPALRVTLDAAAGVTVLVCAWDAVGEALAASGDNPTDSLVPLVADALREAGLGDDGELTVVRSDEAFAGLGADAAHALLRDIVGPVACVAVQALEVAPAAVSETAPAVGGQDEPVATAAEPVGAVPAQRDDPYARMTSRSSGPATARLELLRDVELLVTAELGRTRMSLREVLSLTPGTVVELDRAAGSPVDLLVNGTLVARGEVVVVDEEFGVRITELVHADDGDLAVG